MQNSFILTPYFLDQSVPELRGLAEKDWRVIEHELPPGDPQSRMSKLHEALAAQVAETVKAGDRPVSIVGDCCATIGMLAGLQRAAVQPYLIWLDAHGDFNTWETTPSGFLGGMPLAMVAGLGEQTMVQAVGLQTLAHKKILLTDGRDLDPGERTLLASSSVNHLPDTKALMEIPVPDMPLYVHFDTDIINPRDAPAMSYQAPGGPRASELEAVFRHLAQTRQVVAVSVSTWNPKLDTDGQSRDVSMRLLDVLVQG